MRRNIEKEVINGKSLKQVEKQFPEVKNIEQVSQKLRETMAIDEFWDIDDKDVNDKGAINEKDTITLGDHAPREEILTT